MSPSPRQVRWRRLAVHGRVLTKSWRVKRCIRPSLGSSRFLVLAFSLTFILGPIPASADLEFLVATDSDAAYTKNPSRYDRVRLPPGSAADVVFVERQIVLSIPLRDIQSVTIDRKPFAKNMEDAIRQMQGEPPQSGSQAKDAPAAFDTTFGLHRGQGRVGQCRDRVHVRRLRYGNRDEPDLRECVSVHRAGKRRSGRALLLPGAALLSRSGPVYP